MLSGVWVLFCRAIPCSSGGLFFRDNLYAQFSAVPAVHLKPRRQQCITTMSRSPPMSGASTRQRRDARSSESQVNPDFAHLGRANAGMLQPMTADELTTISFLAISSAVNSCRTGAGAACTLRASRPGAVNHIGNHLDRQRGRS